MTREEWLQKAKELSVEGRMFVDGKLKDAESKQTIKVIAPRDGSILGEIARGDHADVELAVAAARREFEKGSWSKLDPRTRQKVLYRLSDLILEHKEELALLESLDTGHPISDAMNVDVPSAARTYRWYGEAIDKVYGEVAPAPRSAMVTVTREALGVIGAVVPWNYPLIISAWKVAPALAAGNSVVLKPAEDASLSAIKIAQLALEAGVPAGVFNVVTGLGAEAGKALGLSAVDKITFTGSPTVGRMFQGYAAESNGKQVALELGGKSPHLVFEDVEDISAAASAITWGIFYNAGQTCHGGSRLLVHKSIKDKLLAEIVKQGKEFVLGDPIDPRTQVSAIVNEKQLNRIRHYLDVAKQENLQVVLGGSTEAPEASLKDGYFVQPTVIDGVSPKSVIAQEEIFGPVLAVITFETEEEAIKIANDTEYGLAASVWTSNVTRAHKVARSVRAGTVWINTFDVADIIVPFGGFKNSGFGRDRSLHALDSYTGLKTTWLHLGN
jgi:gamma-glutamyl-gamma-aminobutyraldehyde dehydrogenase/4-guanidinobutyraldehyde dehydrogenase/NAD-dependent aldehyde dehydrogenase